jgi:hypothetical protein
VRSGARLSAPAEADVIVEIRLGALSVDQMSRVLGVPRLVLPVAPTLTTVTIPELPLYSRRDRTGVAEFSLFAYRAVTGELVGVATPVGWGVSRIRSHTALMVLSWGEQAAKPRRVSPAG